MLCNDNVCINPLLWITRCHKLSLDHSTWLLAFHSPTDLKENTILKAMDYKISQDVMNWHQIIELKTDFKGCKSLIWQFDLNLESCASIRFKDVLFLKPLYARFYTRCCSRASACQSKTDMLVKLCPSPCVWSAVTPLSVPGGQEQMKKYFTSRWWMSSDDVSTQNKQEGCTF